MKTLLVTVGMTLCVLCGGFGMDSSEAAITIAGFNNRSEKIVFQNQGNRIHIKRGTPHGKAIVLIGTRRDAHLYSGDVKGKCVGTEIKLSQSVLRTGLNFEGRKQKVFEMPPWTEPVVLFQLINIADCTTSKVQEVLVRP